MYLLFFIMFKQNVLCIITFDQSINMESIIPNHEKFDLPTCSSYVRIISYIYELLEIYWYFNERIRINRNIAKYYCKVDSNAVVHLMCGKTVYRIRGHLVVDAVLSSHLASNAIELKQDGSKNITYQEMSD